MRESESTTGASLAKSLSRGVSSDMSSGAVLRRLEIVDELRELAKDLQAVKRLGPLESLGSVDAYGESTTQHDRPY